jgi:hypothetical protein
VIQLLWLGLTAVQAAAAGVWWWLMPGGFPSSSTEFWVNQVAPLVVIGLVILGLTARGRVGAAILPPFMAAVPVFWMAASVASVVAFGASMQSRWKLVFIAAALLTAEWIRQFRSRVQAWWLVPVFCLPAALAGWALPGTQRALDPATRPAGVPMPSPPAGGPDAKLIRLTHDAQVHPKEGLVVIRRDKLVLTVRPLLTFADRSPDRFWTSWAEPEDRQATRRTPVGKLHGTDGYTFFYRDEAASVLDVLARGRVIEVDARSQLDKPIFSHQNSFAELMVQGHKKLSVVFSPTPRERVEVGSLVAPLHFATLDEAGVFHVLVASQRERGPFTELARGSMKREDPLVLTLYDEDVPVFRVTLADWARQASTRLSPGAGWGVAENTIELVRGAEPDNAPVLVTATLAATTVGRGSRSVGHAPGTYQDRITVAPVTE